MLLGTAVLFGLTLISGYAAFTSVGMAAESIKLLYAFLALTTVVCAMITMAESRSSRMRTVAEPSGQDASNGQSSAI